LQAACIDTHSDPWLTVDEMLECLQVLQKSGREGGALVPDELIYKACLIVCGRYRKRDDAQRIFHEMKKNRVQLSRATYGAYTHAIASSASYNTENSGQSGRESTIMSPERSRKNSSNVKLGMTKSWSMRGIENAEKAEKVFDRSRTYRSNSSQDRKRPPPIQLSAETSEKSHNRQNSASPYAVPNKVSPHRSPRAPSSSHLSLGWRENSQNDKPEMRINWRTILLDNTCICDSCGALLSDSYILAGFDIDVDALKSKCVHCSYEFTPWLRIRYEVTLEDDSGEITTKFENIREHYLSPLSLRKKVLKALQKNKPELCSLRSFRNNHSTIFWNLLWYFYQNSLSTDCLIGKMNIALKISFFDDPKRCIFPKDKRKLEENLKELISAIDGRSMKDAIVLFQKFRAQEAEEHLPRFKSVWSHSVYSSLEVLCSIFKSYSSFNAFVKAFEEASKNVKLARLDDGIPPKRVWAFRKTFPFAPMYIPNFLQIAEDIKQSRVGKPP